MLLTQQIFLKCLVHASMCHILKIKKVKNMAWSLPSWGLHSGGRHRKAKWQLQYEQ